MKPIFSIYTDLFDKTRLRIPREKTDFFPISWIGWFSGKNKYWLAQLAKNSKTLAVTSVLCIYYETWIFQTISPFSYDSRKISNIEKIMFVKFNLYSKWICVDSNEMPFQKKKDTKISEYSYYKCIRYAGIRLFSLNLCWFSSYKISKPISFPLCETLPLCYVFKFIRPIAFVVSGSDLVETSEFNVFL